MITALNVCIGIVGIIFFILCLYALYRIGEGVLGWLLNQWY